MKNPAKSLSLLFCLIACVVSSLASAAFAAAAVTASGTNNNNAPAPAQDEVVELSVFCVTGGFGATPGGFKDINYGRQLLEWGMLPFEGEFTAEGLFSEFDLPTPTAGKSKNLLDVTGDAKVATILNRPEVTHLAQIGFASGLDPATWKRDPLLVVVVADVSGSMKGNLGLLKETIQVILSKLGPEDALALVSFSDDARLEFGAAYVNASQRERMRADIDALKIRGSTNIEDGLKMGFDSALKDLSGFKGRRRVILITDAMPNVDSTEPESFMKLAEAASLKGVGLTTIGVGMVFDADFVKRVSSVSGGNAYYFPSAAEMEKRMDDDFDFMVTELAYDMHLQVNPAPGYRVLDVYGLPGNTYARTPQGGMEMDLATLFLSREKGGIFMSFAKDAPAATSAQAPEKIGDVSLSYVLRGEPGAKTSAFDLTAGKSKKAGAGLLRGEFLVNEYEALRAASRAFYGDGNLNASRDMVKALCGVAARTRDSALKKEIRLLENLRLFLDVAAEMPALTPDMLNASPEKSPLLGLWRPSDRDMDDDGPSYMAMLPSGRVVEVDKPDAKKRKHRTPITIEWKGNKIVAKGNRAGDLGDEATLKVENGKLLMLEEGADEGITLERADPANLWK